MGELSVLAYSDLLTLGSLSARTAFQLDARKLLIFNTTGLDFQAEIRTRGCEEDVKCGFKVKRHVAENQNYTLGS